jgi:hypothetical protein
MFERIGAFSTALQNSEMKLDIIVCEIKYTINYLQEINNEASFLQIYKKCLQIATENYV